MRIITGDEALRTRQDSQFLQSFSKMYNSGMTAVVLYKIVANERLRKNSLVVGACWGHKIDFTKIPLNRSFIKTNSVLNEENKPVTADAMLQFSRVAPAYLDGEKAYKTRLEMTSGQPQPIIDKKLKDIEEEFEKASPAVGKLTYLITTECIFIPLDDSGKPKVDEARLCTQELSNKKLEEISKVINDRRVIINVEEGYAEVQYAFGNTKDKKIDGQVAPTGQPSGYTLAEMYPDEWEQLKPMLDRLPEDSDQIMARNRAFDTVDEEEIVAAISSFAASANTYLTMLDESDAKNMGRLKKNCLLLQELGADLKFEEYLKALEAANKQTAEEKESRTKKLLEQEVEEAVRGNDEDRDEVAVDNDTQSTESKNTSSTEDKGDIAQNVAQSEGF